MKRKILLITTKGCEGCKILNNIIQKVLDDYSKDVDYEIKDKDNIDIDFLKTNHIIDFPTAILYQNGRIVFMFAGTKPANVINRFLELHFD